MHDSKLSAAILAGGKSSRMGENKALIKIDNKPIIQHVFEALQEITDDIMIISNEPGIYNFLKFPVYSDVIPHKSPLAGLITALYHCENSHCFILACDMPFIAKELLRKMVQHIEPEKITTAATPERTQPLCAIYPKKVLPDARQAFHKQQYRVSRFMERFSLIKIPAVKNQLFNINTPEDLIRVLSQTGYS